MRCGGGPFRKDLLYHEQINQVGDFIAVFLEREMPRVLGEFVIHAATGV
jgi:hypothetical protein